MSSSLHKTIAFDVLAAQGLTDSSTKVRITVEALRNWIIYGAEQAVLRLRDHYNSRPDLYPDCPTCDVTTRELRPANMSVAMLIVLREVAYLTEGKEEKKIGLKQERKKISETESIGIYYLDPPQKNPLKSAIGECRRLTQGLCFFGLVTRRIHKGFYWLSQKGQSYLDGRIAVPTYVLTREHKTVEVSKDMIWAYEVKARGLSSDWKEMVAKATFKGHDPNAIPTT